MNLPSSMLKCKICNSKNNQIYELDDVPKGAQVFSTNLKKSMSEKTKFIVFECVTCGLVQTKSKKVTGVCH